MVVKPQFLIKQYELMLLFVSFSLNDVEIKYFVDFLTFSTTLDENLISR